jgi:hypothetical protein
MLGLTLGIGMCNQWSRLAQAKTQLPEQPLTLPYAQGNPILLVHPSSQGLPVPDLPCQAEVFRTPPQSGSDLLELLVVEPSWPPRPLSIDQTSQALLFETMDPILDGPRRIAQQTTHFTAAYTLGHQQYPVQTVVVSRLLRTANLILQRKDQSLGIRNLEFSHVWRVSPVTDMRNYL